MSYRHLFATFAVTVAVTGVWAASASADSTSQEQLSQNWAGYVAGGGASDTQFSAVSGSWVQPKANCGAGQTYSAFWVGLGGSGDSSGALEQTGTQADCTGDGATDYYAWYELVPAAPVRLDLAIHPGDKIAAKVGVSGTNVTVSLWDQTTGQSTTKTLQMDSPDTSSAEWIAEAPSSCDGSGSCQPLPLADFGTVEFTSANATANGHTGTINDPNWTANPIALGSGGSTDVSLGAGSSSAGASASGLSSDGSSFSVSVQQSGTSGSSSSGSGGYGSGGGYSGAGGGSGDYGSGGGSGGYGSGGGSGGYGSGGGAGGYGSGGGSGGYGYGGGYPGADGGYGYGGYPGGGGYGYGYGGDGYGAF
ncbi:MAG: hypothetical protein JO262_05950 [Solirubrobacterales bacterium]|nr:hypothetical protein [Solirubrobacterales bacterium]